MEGPDAIATKLSNFWLKKSEQKKRKPIPICLQTPKITFNHSGTLVPPRVREFIDKMVCWKTRHLRNPWFFLGLDKKNFKKASELRTGQFRGKHYARREQSLWKYYRLQPKIKVSGLHKRLFFNPEYVPPWLRPHTSVKQGKARSWVFLQLLKHYGQARKTLTSLKSRVKTGPKKMWHVKTKWKRATKQPSGAKSHQQEKQMLTSQGLQVGVPELSFSTAALSAAAYLPKEKAVPKVLKDMLCKWWPFKQYPLRAACTCPHNTGALGDFA